MLFLCFLYNLMNKICFCEDDRLFIVDVDVVECFFFVFRH